MTHQASTLALTDAFVEEWEAWHREHEAWRTAPTGYLAVTGLFWLSATPQRIPGIPGAWAADDTGPRIELDKEERVEFAGAELRGEHRFGVLPPRTGVTLRAGDDVIEVARRDTHYIVRPRRADHPYLLAYEGTEAYEPDPRWRVRARFVPLTSAAPAGLDTVIPGLASDLDPVGDLEFEVDGQSLSLLAYRHPVPNRGGFVALFRDATSGVTTYRANRTIDIDDPDDDGHTVIDFNRATNLPCAYSDFTTCPLPPARNHLPIAVEAGEKTPRARVVSPSALSAPAVSAEG